MTGESPAELPRRTLLAAGAGVAALAGCLGGDDGTNTTNSSREQDGTGSPNETVDRDAAGSNETDGQNSSGPGETDGQNTTPDNGDSGSQPRGSVDSLTAAGPATTPTLAPDESLQATAVLTNTGTRAGEIPVRISLTRAGTTAASTRVNRSLAPDERATLALTGADSAALGTAIAEAAPGEYTLRVGTDADSATQDIVVQQPPTPALSDLALNTDGVTTDTTTPLRPTVTLANTGDLTGRFAVRLQLGAGGETTDSPDPPLPRETTVEQLVTPGGQATLVPSLDVSALEPGSYTVTVTARPVGAPSETSRRATLNTSLTVEQAPGELVVTVYTQTDGDEHRATGGTLRVVPVAGSGTDTASNSDPVATHDLGDGATVTLSEGVANDQQYRLETVDLNDGVYPDGQQTVTVDGQTDVEFIAAYEFQGADSFRTAVYLFAPNPSGPNTIDPAASYYGWATHAADDNHYVRYLRATRNPSYEFGEPIHDHGTDLARFDGELIDFSPPEQVRIDGEAYGHRYGEVATDWGALGSDGPAFDPETSGQKNTGNAIPTRPLTSFTGGRPEKQQFAGEVTIDGQTLHQYNVSVENYPTSRAFVDPETGYMMRWETQKSYAGPSEQGFEIWSYSDHGEIPTLSVSSIDFVTSPPPQL